MTERVLPEVGARPGEELGTAHVRPAGEHLVAVQRVPSDPPARRVFTSSTLGRGLPGSESRWSVTGSGVLPPPIAKIRFSMSNAYHAAPPDVAPFRHAA